MSDALRRALGRAGCRATVLSAAAIAVLGARRSLIGGGAAGQAAAARPLLLQVVAIAAAVLALAAAVLAWREASRWRPAPATRARLLGYALLAGALGSLWLVYPYRARLVLVPFGAALGAWAFVAEVGRAVSPPVPGRLLRRLDAACLALLLFVPLGEACLRVVAALWPSPLLVQEEASAVARVRANRYLPGHVRYGFPCNEHGEYDEPFTPRRAGELNVVSVGDSFAAGVVPHGFHFTTVCEESLPGTRVQNLGVPAIGPREYLHLLVTEGLPLRPDVVVVNLFLGNDLERNRGGSRMRALLDRDNLLLWQVPRRLWILARESRRGGTSGRAAEPVEASAIVPAAEYAARHPWLADPLVEPPAMSEATFLEIERQRARLVCGDNEREYQDLFAQLARIERAVRPVPLLFVLIPDEFQVEDALWAQVGAADPTLERDRPQRRVGAWLRERGVACLDLLPLLRAVPPLADGGRHVYHLRDTHFNARGNRVAGEALAQWLAAMPR